MLARLAFRRWGAWLLLFGEVFAENVIGLNLGHLKEVANQRRVKTTRLHFGRQCVQVLFDKDERAVVRNLAGCLAANPTVDGIIGALSLGSIDLVVVNFKRRRAVERYP